MNNALFLKKVNDFDIEKLPKGESHPNHPEWRPFSFCLNQSLLFNYKLFYKIYGRNPF
jgi:hypothetical protein